LARRATSLLSVRGQCIPGREHIVDRWTEIEDQPLAAAARVVPVARQKIVLRRAAVAAQRRTGDVGREACQCNSAGAAAAVGEIVSQRAGIAVTELDDRLA